MCQFCPCVDLGLILQNNVSSFEGYKVNTKAAKGQRVTFAEYPNKGNLMVESSAPLTKWNTTFENPTTCNPPVSTGVLVGGSTSVDGPTGCMSC